MMNKKSEWFDTCRRVSIVILLSSMSLLFVGCSSHIKRCDGPPTFYVDETKIPNAVPKVEKLSRIGNKPWYVVFGKRYHVMRTSKNYHAVGIASWYGTQFHSRHTSSGEPYNMLAMTAAHRSLPLPTYVEVTNLKNKRKIIVKVNDRGPFHANRIIDLSYVAAKKLGMLGKGTAPVSVTAIDPSMYGRPRRMMIAKRSLKPVQRITQTTSWQVIKNNVREQRRLPHSSVYLQVGAFKNRLNAIKLQRKLMAQLKTNVILVPPSTTHKYFLVKIGPFTDLAAQRFSARLRHLGYVSNRLYGA